MLSALKAETLRLLTLRSTLVYAILLTGALYGPPVLVVLLGEGNSTYTASDIGQFAMIFMIVAIVFAGSSTAGEIRRGSLGVTFLSQRHRWVSYFARLIVAAVYISVLYVIGLILAWGVFVAGSDTVDLSDGGWAYLGLVLVQILSFVFITSGIAALTRSTAAAIALPLAWLLLIESLLASVPIKAFENIAQWTPLQNWSFLLGKTYEPASSAFITHGVLAAAGAVTVVTLVFIAGGCLAHIKRDIPA